MALSTAGRTFGSCDIDTGTRSRHGALGTIEKRERRGYERGGGSTAKDTYYREINLTDPVVLSSNSPVQNHKRIAGVHRPVPRRLPIRRDAKHSAAQSPRGYVFSSPSGVRIVIPTAAVFRRCLLVGDGL